MSHLFVLVRMTAHIIMRGRNKFATPPPVLWAMISVRFHSEAAARAFCLNTRLICLAESLGGVESLVEHPVTMTHVSVEGSTLEVPRELVRISIGIEDIEDLLADVDAALASL